MSLLSRAMGAALVAILLVSLGPPGQAAEPGGLSLAPLAAKDWDQAKAAHLLRRAGFGGAPEEVERLVELGPESAVDHLIDYVKQAYAVAPPKFDEIIMDDENRPDLRSLSEEERQAYIQKRQMAERQGNAEARVWWLERMVDSPRPLEEKMTLFWHGHFTSGAREVRRAVFMYEQNELLRRNALGNFRDLLLAVSKDRAMLVYLDNARNNKSQPNENYARELLELFTLGVGNYSEADIKAAARAFTGWSFDREGFLFRKNNHDEGKKTFLGETGAFNGDDIIDIILRQPACSRFLARKLLVFFVRPEPQKQLVEALAAEIRKNKYELEPVMRTLFRSRAFYHAKSCGTLVKSPVELLVGTARQLGVRIENLPGAERALAAMGQELMQPPNVKGWPGGLRWINSASLFHRYNHVSALVRGGDEMDRGVPAQMRSAALADAKDSAAAPKSGSGSAEAPKAAQAMMAPKSRLGGAQPAYDPTPTLTENNLTAPEQIVAFYAAHLLAVPLPEEKQTALVTYLRGTDGQFDVSAWRIQVRIRTMLQLLCSSPEYQLN